MVIMIVQEFEATKTEMNDMNKKGMCDDATFGIMKSKIGTIILQNSQQAMKIGLI